MNAKHIVEVLIDSPTPDEVEVMKEALCKSLSLMLHVEVRPADLVDVKPNEVMALYYRHALGLSLDEVGARMDKPIARPIVSRLLKRGLRNVIAKLSPLMTLNPEMFHGK